MKPTIILTRGLPASGKSTYAEELVHSSRGDVIRLERDLLRDQLYKSREYSAPEGASEEEKEAFKQYLTARENTITIVQMAMAEAAIKAGKSVVVADTNLRAKFARDWMAFAEKLKADFKVVKFDDISVEECIRRDKLREKSVGEKVIRDMSKFLVKGKIPDLAPLESKSWTVEPYDNPENLPSAIIVDIDGTLAKMSDRSPYDWHRVGEDYPVKAVIDAVSAAYQEFSHIIVMSGRDGSCRDITDQWLFQHLDKVSDYQLLMRAPGDNRKDDLVKYELFNEHVRDKYHVKYVLDDRRQVVVMWRALGLACFQVQDGDF